MSPGNKDEVQLDFVLYLGDPDEGAEKIASAKALEEFATYGDKLAFRDHVYGALTITRGGETILRAVPDPIIKLMTTLMRTLPYVIDGEPENALLNESEHGFLIEPNGDKVNLSFFAGSDAFEPDEFLLESESMPMDAFGGQLVDMGERLMALLEKFDPENYKSEYLGRDLHEFLEVGRDAIKAYRLEREHGLRPL